MGQNQTHAAQQRASLFDRLVGGCEQRGRNVEAERFRGLEIDRELVFDRLLNRQIGWLGALEDAVDVPCCLAELFREISAISDQAA